MRWQTVFYVEPQGVRGVCPWVCACESADEAESAGTELRYYGHCPDGAPVYFANVVV